MSEKLYSIGIIGTGMVAERHIECFLKTGRAEISWVAARGEDSLKRIKEKFAIGKTTTNYQDILNDGNVDAVIICTPPPVHKTVFIDSVAAGKHILVEKPLAMNLSDVDEMIEAERSNPNLVICDCSARHSRLQPKYKAVKDIIGSGIMGDIYAVHHNCIYRQNRSGIEYHPAAKWFLNKAIAGGGPLLDWGVYDLSFHLGVLGDMPELVKVRDVLLKSGLDEVDPGADVYDVEEHFLANLEFSGGLRYFWERGNNANMEVNSETRIYGTRGGLKFGYHTWDPPQLIFYDVDNHSKGKARSKIIEVDMTSHGSDDFELAAHYIKALDGTEKVVLPLSLARKHLKIILDCYNAGEGGC
ncbi:MAG: Gfo/Idh/MocA family oxidoreductase [Luteolibacter sp.]